MADRDLQDIEGFLDNKETAQGKGKGLPGSKGGAYQVQFLFCWITGMPWLQ